MAFPSPQHAVDDPEYSVACREALQPFLQRMIEDATGAGWDEEEVSRAIEELGRLRSLAASHSQHDLPAVSDFPLE